MWSQVKFVSLTWTSVIQNIVKCITKTRLFTPTQYLEICSLKQFVVGEDQTTRGNGGTNCSDYPSCLLIGSCLVSS